MLSLIISYLYTGFQIAEEYSRTGLTNVQTNNPRNRANRNSDWPWTHMPKGATDKNVKLVKKDKNSNRHSKTHSRPRAVPAIPLLLLLSSLSSSSSLLLLVLSCKFWYVFWCYLRQPITSWTVANIAEWLAVVGLHRYAHIFRQHRVDGEAVSELTPDTLIVSVNSDG